MLKYNRNLKKHAGVLRVNMTEAEKLLWSKIRKKQLKNFQFYRQKSIGNYIVDFYCPSANMVVELDGGQHYSVEGRAKDKIRDSYMKKAGLKVLRFSDLEVLKNLDSVLEVIWGNL
ncbi:MAG: endonuclease domain-containing protein [Candidatus Omnitrophica bacterium]|nr:endonuclease domain-containing protein [Candidatus Omnitrophota bacterium]